MATRQKRRTYKTLIFLTQFVSPYINRFLQPDSIIPNPANPQSLNRFGYVLNNPIRFNDPTGHVCEDPEKEDAVCFGSGTTRVGNRMVRGNGAELGKAKNRPITPKDEPPIEAWEYNADIDIGLHIGPTRGANIPNYYGETADGSAYIPYIPGVSNPNTPNLCVGGGGAASVGCLFSALASIPFAYGSTNANPNFFISINVNYNEAIGMTMSDFQWANRYSGQAVFTRLAIDNKAVFIGNSYMPVDGSWRPILGSGGTYDGNNQISIEVVVFHIVNTPNGPGAMPTIKNFVLPSLPEMRNMTQTANP